MTHDQRHAVEALLYGYNAERTRNANEILSESCPWGDGAYDVFYRIGLLIAARERATSFHLCGSESRLHTLANADGAAAHDAEEARRYLDFVRGQQPSLPFEATIRKMRP